MKELNTNTTGLVVGSFAALVHLVWAIMVAIGLAQGYLDFIFSVHFLNNPFTVGSFDIIKTIMLVVVTFVLGYLFGWVFAYVWNMLIKRK